MENEEKGCKMKIQKAHIAYMILSNAIFHYSLSLSVDIRK